MPRNTSFHPDREPLRHQGSLQLLPHKITGPFTFLNPTRAHFRHVGASDRDSASSSDLQQPVTGHSEPGYLAHDAEFKWTSRNNRKGRHALSVTPAKGSSDVQYATPPSTSSFREVVRGIGRMFTRYPYWDVSWLVAVVFTWGSIIWVINACFVYLPFVAPSTEFHNEILYGGGITAFIGATVFEVGSFLLMAEAINENRTGCFGWAVEQVFKEHHIEKGGYKRLKPDTASCVHHHTNQKNLVGKSATQDSRAGGALSSPVDAGNGKSWVWFPSRYEFRTHYSHELGFLACLSQLIGATIFWIAGFTALPGINNHLSQGLLDGIYWTPQVVGAIGFIISGTLFMIETQTKWYIPALGTLGWHIGAWNLIGGWGFFLSPAFGYSPHHWAQYQACLSTFWGSWAFLIGSVIQWYESLAKYPVDVTKAERTS